MSDLSSYDVARYQRMLRERRVAINTVKSIMNEQQHMPAGSQQRDATMRGVGNGLDRTDELNKALIGAGIMDGYGRLTDKAVRAGITMPS